MFHFSALAKEKFENFHSNHFILLSLGWPCTLIMLRLIHAIQGIGCLCPSSSYLSHIHPSRPHGSKIMHLGHQTIGI